LRHRAAALLLLVLGVSTLWADDSTLAPAVVVRPFSLPTSAGGDALAKGVRDSLGNELRRDGFVLVDGSDAHPARFEATAVMAHEGGSLVLQLQITDLTTLSVVSSDIISVVEGLTALDPINTTVAGVVARARDYWAKIQKDPLPVPPLQDAIVLLSKDEGADIFWQGHQPIGKITDGKLTAPYYPFPSNTVLDITIEKKGWRSKTVTIALNPATLEYPLPALDKLRVEELHVFDQGGRLLGLGGEYRNYFIPDWAFWSAEAYPFVQMRPGIEGTRPVLHLDLGGSAGTWLYFSADSWFRFGLQSALWLGTTVTSSSKTPGAYLDGIIVPFGVLLEWNVFGVLIDNRIQVPFSLGLPTGVEPQRWMLIDGTFPMLSIGVVQKW
jgi:hypothetical protein